MLSIEEYQAKFSEYLKEYMAFNEPNNLYEPIQYILDLGGKRLRPTLTLLATDIFGGDYKNSLNTALAIELFHNFSLMHDDIMDDAPLRRGEQTVHEKWDLNAGILSGDAMLILAYKLFENYEPNIFRELAELFSKTALQVCEGQQYDIDFETRDDVTLTEYLKMIEYKTAVLIGAAMKMGAIVARASNTDQDKIYEFGKNLGIAFQIQDDYLDAFGDPESFGKQIGGDIIENKKTFLYLKAIAFCDSEEMVQLEHLYSIYPEAIEEKVNTVKQIFESTGSAEATKMEIEVYTLKAFSVLSTLDLSEDKKDLLKQFGEELMNRKV
ncbi:MAG: polyprenyl synthetase family protein [Flavobacteriaceae bacterium]|nr:polyprenyl synthetase family protein [Flavobacteriaceae bacterium]